MHNIYKILEINNINYMFFKECKLQEAEIVLK